VERRDLSAPRYAGEGEREEGSTLGRCMPGRRERRSTLGQTGLPGSLLKSYEDVHPIFSLSHAGTSRGSPLFSSPPFLTDTLSEMEASSLPPREKRREEPRLSPPGTA